VESFRSSFVSTSHSTEINEKSSKCQKIYLIGYARRDHFGVRANEAVCVCVSLFRVVSPRPESFVVAMWGNCIHNIEPVSSVQYLWVRGQDNKLAGRRENGHLCIRHQVSFPKDWALLLLRENFRWVVSLFSAKCYFRFFSNKMNAGTAYKFHSIYLSLSGFPLALLPVEERS
jgi:hypothetical protein